MKGSDISSLIQRDTENTCITHPFSEFKDKSDNNIPYLRSSSKRQIEETIKDYPKTQKAYESLINSTQIMALWDMAGFITTEKLKMNDHGRIHAMVTASSALKLLEILYLSGIKPDIIESGVGDIDDAYLVILISSLCHDIGNSIHRNEHLNNSLLLVQPILEYTIMKGK